MNLPPSANSALSVARFFVLFCAGCTMQAQFEQTDQLGLQLWQDERQYDAATCMFALHYFFEQESTLMMFMQTVAANLKPGGVQTMRSSAVGLANPFAFCL
jgi:hypothetical protein